MHAQEAEARRPDYLKRTKRTAQELDLATDTDGTLQGSALQPAANIGITDSPVKGRRLTLFQETSDESFEESLMAGGYGRYVSKFSVAGSSYFVLNENVAFGRAAVETI